MKTSALNRLYDKYYPAYWPGERSCPELLQWVAQHLDIEEIPLSVFAPHFIWRVKHNVENSLLAKRIGLTREQFRFVAYRLQKTKRMEAYYEENYAGKREPDSDIYLIFEEHIGLVESNQSRLILEINIAGGISKQDYEEKSEIMDFYVTYLYFLDQHWY